jgi:uncharacterized surface anchored protein
MKTKTRKIMAIVSLFLILLTSLPINTFATFITDINSNAQFGVISGSLANYGHELHYANYDGQTYIAFCTQYGMTSPNGGDYVYNGSFVAEYKSNLPQYEKIAEMIYFGYTMNYGYGIPQSAEAIRAACCTQQYVWEYIHNNIDSSFSVPSRESWNGNYMSTGHLADWTARTENYYNTYHGNTSFNGTTAKVSLGESTKVTDTNGKLAAYPSFTQNKDGITFYHEQGSNDLIITASSDCTADSVSFKTRDYGLFQLMPNGTPYNSSTMSNYVYIRFTSGAVQNLIFSNYVDPSEFNINVQVEYGNALLIKTNSVGNTLAGAKFSLYKDANCTQVVRTGTSDSNGQIQFNRLAPGTYYVKEISVPTGYLLDTTVQSVQVKVNETSQVTFKNNEPTGELKLIKTDAETGNENRVDGTSHHGDATLKGTEYTLYAKEDIYNVAKTVKYFSANEEIATYTFDANGIATINITTKSNKANLTTDGNVLKGLPMGTYYSKETKVPEGYLQDNDTHTYTLKYKDMNTSVIKVEGTLNNTVQKAKFEVIKVSTVTNTTAPIVEGAEFTAILTKYVDYYGSFDEALKHLDEFSEDEYSVFKTGTNGHGVSGLLAYGKYTVNETYCPSDKINPVQEFYVTIDKNSDGVIKELVENDTPFQSYIKMIKIDKNTGKTVTFSNTTFSLFKLNETTNEWERVKCKVGKTSYDTWTTDENSIAYTETKLDAGTYKIDEIVVPNGFLQLDEECIFEVNRSNDTLEYDNDYDAYITVKVGNEQPVGTLIVDKSVAIREDVDTSLVDISDLSGIEFKLTAKENIIDYADGAIIYEKGQEIGTYNLDKEGNLKIEKLPMGTYELEEIKTLDGLVLDTTKHEIKFEQKDLTTKVYEEKIDLVNNTTVFEFSKTDVTGDKELEGAKLTVLDKDGNVVDAWTSSDKTHKIEGLLVGETYTLREEIAPDGYVRATDIEFKVENTKEVQKVNMKDKIVDMSKVDIGGEEIEGAEITVTDKEGNVIDSWTSTKEEHKIKGLVEGETYILHEEVTPYGYVKATDIEFTVSLDKENEHIEMIDKVVEITKTDLVTGDEIEGAELKVVDQDGNVVDEWTSTKEAHKVTGLEEGKTYTLIETTAPYGYELTEEIEFTVTINKETQKVEMKDMPILKDIRVVKVGSETKEIIKDNFTFGIYEDEECTQLIKEVKSDKENGYAIFEDLRYGTYYIKEIKAPNGYKLSEKIVKVEINDEGVSIEGNIITENEDNVYSFDFENEKIETPKTGDESNIGFWFKTLGISFLILLGLIIFGIKKFRK